MGDQLRIVVKNGLPNNQKEFKQIACTRNDQAINNIISQCISTWGLEPDPTFYALRLERGSNTASKETLANGKVYLLVSSNSKKIQELVESLQSYGSFHRINELPQNLDTPDNGDYLNLLVDEFDGVAVILKRLEYDLQTHEESKTIGKLLEALSIIINKRPKVLKTIEAKGGEVIDLLAKGLAYPDPGTEAEIMTNWDTTTKHGALFLTIIQKSETLRAKVRDEVAIHKLLEIIAKTNIADSVHINALALFNELVLHSEDRSAIAQPMIRKQIPQILAQRFKANDPQNSDVLMKQLYYVQCWILLKYEKSSTTSIEKKNLHKITELIDIAFPDRKDINGSGTLHKNRHTEYYKTLGFDSHVDPSQDFQKPPGELGLQIIYDFAQRNNFHKIVTEFSCQHCPFAKSALGLIRVLCDVLGVGEDPNLVQISSKMSYYPFILAREDFLLEMFQICIDPFLKTWRDMHASLKDFTKVMEVTRDQIQNSLNGRPQDLQAFKDGLPTYADISKIWKEGGRDRDNCGAVRTLKVNHFEFCWFLRFCTSLHNVDI